MPNFRKLTREQLFQVDLARIKYKPDLVEIEGVVSESGQGGWESAGGYRIHCFTFAAWRRPGQPIVNRQLTILRPIKRQANDYFNDYPSLSLQRFKFLISKDEFRAILAGPASAGPDPSGLQEIADELAKPVILETKRFRTLTLNRRINRFEGSARWNGKKIDVSFDPESGNDITRALKVGETLWKNARAWQKKVDDYAVAELLPLKNDAWLGDDEKPLTARQFKARMTLEAITIDAEGCFEFWHDDGDLFYGHSIQIGGTLEGLTRADIPG